MILASFLKGDELNRESGAVSLLVYPWGKQAPPVLETTLMVKSGQTSGRKQLLHFTYHNKDQEISPAPEDTLSQARSVSWGCQRFGRGTRKTDELVLEKIRH